MTCLIPAYSSGAGKGSEVKGTGPNEKRYPAQMTAAPVKTAVQNDNRCVLGSVRSMEGLGRAVMKNHTPAAANDTGMKTKDENFDSTASPVAAPNKVLLSQF